MGAKSKFRVGQPEWAMGIVNDFRAKQDMGGKGYFNIEANRVVATDGKRLAWQECDEVPADIQGVYNDKVERIQGVEFPRYQEVIPQNWNINLIAILDKDTLDALKILARLGGDGTFGTLNNDGARLYVEYGHLSPKISATLDIRVDTIEAKPFKIGINLRFLYDALHALYSADARGSGSTAYAQIQIVDGLSPIAIKSPYGGFFSITMPCWDDSAFCWKAGDTVEALN